MFHLLYGSQTELCFSFSHGYRGAKLIPAMVGNIASEERQGAKGGCGQHEKEQLVGCGCGFGRHRRNFNVELRGIKQDLRVRRK